MPHIVTMAAVVAGATEASIASWSAAVGDRIDAGATLAEVETEKALVDLPADASGTIRHLAVDVGAPVTVGAPIAVLSFDDDTPEAVEDAIRSIASAGATPVPAATPEPVAAPAPATPAAAPADHAPTQAAPSSADRVLVSPLARRTARLAGIDPRTLRGSGPGGRVLRSDVEAAARAAPAARATAPAAAVDDVVPLTRMRAAIARRLTESKQTVPHFYLQGRVDAGRLLALRAELNQSGAVRISVNDLVVKAVAVALGRVPDMNTVFTEDGLRRFHGADVGLAVALDDGLVVPVIRGVDRLSVGALAAETRSLAERAREGALRQDELAGGAITVSNLGMYGVENFTAIINPPQAAILAVGAAREDVLVVDGRPAVGTSMAFTLSVDHRAVDGAVAAAWMREFSGLLENPVTILV